MNAELTDMITNCAACQEYRNHQPAEPPSAHEILSQTWSKVGTDLFQLRGKDYVIVVDYMPKFFDLSQIPDQSGPTVVLHSKRIFSKFVFPQKYSVILYHSILPKNTSSLPVNETLTN